MTYVHYLSVCLIIEMNSASLFNNQNRVIQWAYSDWEFLNYHHTRISNFVNFIKKAALCGFFRSHAIKTLEDVRQRQASETPEHRKTMWLGWTSVANTHATSKATGIRIFPTALFFHPNKCNLYKPQYKKTTARCGFFVGNKSPI